MLELVNFTLTYLPTENSCKNGKCVFKPVWVGFGYLPEYSFHLPRYNGVLKELRERAVQGKQPFKDCHRWDHKYQYFDSCICWVEYH